MKKWISVAFVLILMLLVPAALAQESYDDNPFRPGVDYTEKYNDYGAKPSMLNFGSIDMADINAIYDNSTKKTKIEKISADKILDALVEEDTFYYIYAKFQTSKSVPEHDIDAMLVMTDPLGKYYSNTVTIHIDGTGKNKRYSGLAWYSDATTPFVRCYLENGELPTGTYTFTMYINEEFFRSTKVKVY